MPTSSVLVLGAGPNATAPTVEAVFTANTAISWYADQISHIPKKVAVASSYELSPFNWESSNSLSAQYIQKFNLIKSANCDYLIALHSDVYPEGVQALVAHGYDKQIFHRSFEQCRKMQECISGVKEPVVSIEHFLANPSPWAIYNLLKSIISSRLSLKYNSRSVVSSAFRPSTGVIALLCAIDEYGSDCNYFISGISLKNRKTYANGDPAILNQTRSWRLAPHILADRAIFAALKRKYSITML